MSDRPAGHADASGEAGRPPPRWSGGIGFVLATIGSAIGLGSVWKFPYEAGANGGGLFVVPYLAGLALVVLPLLLAEFAVGRAGRGDAVASIETVAGHAGASRAWGLVGLLGIATGVAILSFYAVIGGWTLAYALDALLMAPPGATAAQTQQRFDALLAAPGRVLGFTLLFLALTTGVVAAGVEKGIEAACRLLMPALFVTVLLLAAVSLAVGDARAALDFLFGFDPARMRPGAWLDALGLGFFSIGVGLGAMITYAAYAGEAIDLKRTALLTMVGDTTVSLLAGLAIFPLVFRFGLDPAGGPGLMFVTLPLAFAQLPFGGVIGLAFYLLLAMSALASAVSLLELPVARLCARGWPRPAAAMAAGGAIAALAVPTILSFGPWSGWRPLAGLPGFAHASLFDLIDFATSDLMLPAAGLALAVFAGWIVPAATLGRELGLSGLPLALLAALLRLVVPGLIAALIAARWLA
ncbi:sodium-dependent transporter [Alsobacter sp. R-9]